MKVLLNFPSWVLLVEHLFQLPVRLGWQPLRQHEHPTVCPSLVCLFREDIVFWSKFDLRNRRNLIGLCKSQCICPDAIFCIVPEEDTKVRRLHMIILGLRYKSDDHKSNFSMANYVPEYGKSADRKSVV